MKKSLSVLVAGAMVSSMFASVAFADSTLTTEQKLQALIKAGIFDADGTGAGFELDKEMTREQFAKVLAKVVGLTEVSGTSYTDVAADRWSAGYIQAVSKAKPALMEGQWEGIFNPIGEVTLEELATVAVRALNLEVKAGEVKGGVSDWAKDYVATALASGLLPEKADYTVSAIRSELVEVSHSLVAATQTPAKASVTSAKATGVTKVEVALDKAVDTEKATFTLKKGSSAIALDKVTWSEDKKVATLNLKEGSKITEGSYSVTLGGLNASDIGTASADFTAENEKVTKIEFTNSSDTIARSHKTRIPFQPTNQYGERATLSTGGYTVYATTQGGQGTISKDSDGNLSVLLDTDYTGFVYGTVISINIYDQQQGVSASKTFKIGDYPMVSKVELGDVTYKNGKDSLSAQGDVAIISMKQYDQYGGIITNDITTSQQSSFPKPNVYITPFSEAFRDAHDPAKAAYEIKDDNNDNIDDVVITVLGKPERSEEFTVTVYGGGSTASAKVNVGSLKVAAKAELVQPSGTIAYGDVDKYVELIAYDEAGNKLTPDEIVDNAKNGRFKINASGGIVLGATDAVPSSMLVQSSDTNQNNIIVAAGPNKGKIHIAKATNKGQANLFVSIYGIGVNSNHNINIPLVDVRVPDRLVVATEVSSKAVAGAEFKPKLQVFDQYNEKMTNFSKLDGDEVKIITPNGKSVTYDVYTTVTADSGLTYAGAGIKSLNAFSDKEFAVTTAGAAAGAKMTLKFELRKIEADAGDDTSAVLPGDAAILDSSVSSITRQVTILTDEQAKNLTYSLSAIGEVFNAGQDETYPDPSDVRRSNAVSSKLTKKLTITAKDQSGATVAIPKTVTDVTTDIVNVATVGQSSGEAYVLGNKVGTAKVTVFFNTKENGIDVTKSVQGEVTVKNEPIAVASIAAGAASKTYKNNKTGHIASFMGDKLTVKNQYGNEFVSNATNDFIGDYDKYLQIRYTISNIEGVNVTYDEATKQITQITGTGSFVITAIAANGKTASTTVVITN